MATSGPPSSAFLERFRNLKKHGSDGRLLYAFQHFATNATAVAVSVSITHPLDVVKIRLQMQLAGLRGPLIGMGKLFGNIVKIEGPVALYSGLAPAMTRSFLYGGLRLSLYEPCKSFSDSVFGSANIFVKLVSGTISGAIATAVTNPVDVLKVRLQMNTNPKKSSVGELRQILSEEGLKGFWKGVNPAMTRAGALTASQLATYDESKQALLRWTPLEESFHLHLISSCVAGAVGTLVTAPMDMVKTRLILQQKSKGGIIYRNSFHCAYQVMRTEGFRALYKGGFASYARLGPQTTIMFVVCERLRELTGLKAI
ncbi:putative mitochondrial carrier protein [Dioscorea sansibarensis]